ncbi:MAG: secretin N-terminal domain-containing protein [Verrucomicrobiota bacterium]
MISTVKTFYFLFLALLVTAAGHAQTNPAATPPVFPVPRRNVPLRGATNTNAIVLPARTTRPLTTNAAVSTAVPLIGPNANPAASISTTNAASAITTPVPPPAAVPGVPSISTVPPVAAPRAPLRTNDAGEVATITYNYQGMPLDQILDIYSQLVGRTLLRAPTLVSTLPITLKTQGDLTKTEAITAMEAIFAMNNITLIPIGDKFAKVVPAAESGTAGGKFSDKEVGKLREAGEYVTQIVQLKAANGQEVQQAIQYFAKTPASIILLPTSNTLILRDYSENIKRMLEVIKQIDVVTPLEVKPEVIPIKYALASDISQVLGSLTASGPGVSVGRSNTRGAGVTPGGFQPGGAVGGNQFQGQQQQQNGIPGQSGLGSTGTTGRSAFQRNLNNIVSRIAAGGGDFQVIGNAKIIADERTNSLLVFANDQDMTMIKDIIARLDVVLAQVLIEAIIMEVSLDNGQTVGLSYLQQPKRTGSFTGAGGVNNGQSAPTSGTNGLSALGIQNLASGFSYFGSFGNDLDIAFTAVANDSRINVLSRPRIQTSHAVPATLFIGDTVPYITGTSFGNFNGGSTSQYQEKRVGITLDVLPLINPDGLVVMDIQQNIQQLGTSVQIDGNSVPTTTERSASAKVAVRDRETIILGGFISTSKNKSKTGVPYLKDIPGLGILFRSSSDTTRRVELIVLLRPTVLPTPEAAALVAATERDKLSGVKQGEFEIREMERKRREQLDAEMRKKMGIKDRPL